MEMFFRACLKTDFMAFDLSLPLDSAEIFHRFFFFLVYRITFSLTHIRFIPRRITWAYFSFPCLPESINLRKPTSFREFNNQMINVVSKKQPEFQCSWKGGSLNITQL